MKRLLRLDSIQISKNRIAGIPLSKGNPAILFPVEKLGPVAFRPPVTRSVAFSIENDQIEDFD